MRTLCPTKMYVRAVDYKYTALIIETKQRNSDQFKCD